MRGRSGRALVLGAALALAAGCTTAPSPRPAPPDDPPPVLTPSPQPDSTPRSVDQAKTIWSFEPPDDTSGTSDLLRSGTVSVLTDDGVFYGIDADGRKTWERTFPDDMAEANLAEGVLIVTYSDKDAAIAGLDPRTGKTLWSKKGRSRSSASTDTAYAARCTDQTGTVGDCQLTAYEPRTGRARWTQPTEWNPHPISASFGEDDNPAPAGGPHVLLETAPTGAGDVTITVRDSRTGRARDIRFRDDAVGRVGLAGDTLVMPTHEDEHPKRDRCTSRLRAVDVRTGQVRWKRTIHTAIDKRSTGSGDACSGFQPTLGNGKQAMIHTRDGRPRMLDLTTGKLGWTAPEKTTVAAVGDRVAVLTNEDRSVLSARAIATGKELWRDDVQLPGDQETRIVGNRLLASPANFTCTGGADPDDCDTVIYDARKGTPLAGVPGELTAAGDGWIATDSGGSDEITVYSTR